jgi:ribosome-associated protein
VGIKPKARGAIRRQTLRLVRFLAEDDLDALTEALGADGGTSQRDDHLAALVRWRTRIIDGDEGLQAFVEAYPQADRQHLRSLAHRVRKATDDNRPRLAKQLMAALRKTSGQT